MNIIHENEKNLTKKYFEKNGVVEIETEVKNESLI